MAIAALPFVAGCDAPTRPEHTTRVVGVQPHIAVQPNGDMTVKADVVYPGLGGGPLRLGAPTLGSVSDVKLDGSPRTVTGERVDLDPQGQEPTVEWTVHGAVERYADAAIVTIPVWVVPDGVNDNDKRIPISGSVQLPAPPVGKVRWHGASPASLVVDGNTVRFQGELGSTTPSELTFLLRSDSVPAAPVLAGASRVTAFEGRQGPLDDADSHLAGELRDDRRNEDLLANLYWGAVGLEIAIPFLITLLLIARTAVVRRRATAGIPDEIADPPSDLPPAVVSLLRHDGQDIGNDAVAATILDLGNDRALAIEGITSERFTMKVLGSSQRAGERALLGALAQRANTDGVVVGPPLGLSKDDQWWPTLRRDVVAIARSQGLLRRRYRSGLFITAVVALALTTLPLYARSPETIVGGLVVAAILATLPFVGGYVLTVNGHRQRARWEAYCRHLRAADLGDVGVPGIVVWERALVYAAALGVATQAIGDLS